MSVFWKHHISVTRHRPLRVEKEKNPRRNSFATVVIRKRNKSNTLNLQEYWSTQMFGDPSQLSSFVRGVWRPSHLRTYRLLLSQENPFDQVPRKYPLVNNVDESNHPI